MILLTQLKRNGTVNLLIVLEDSNIERIKHYAQAEILWPQLPRDYATRRPHCIGVGYATAAEIAEIQRLLEMGEQEKAIALVTRGWSYRPELGDHDFGPTVLGEPTKGTKQ